METGKEKVFNTTDRIYTHDDIYNAFKEGVYMSNDKVKNSQTALYSNFLDWIEYRIEKTRRVPTLQDILRVVSAELMVNESDVLGIGYSRKKSLTVARRIIAWFSHTYTNINLEQVALKLNYKDHSSVIYGMKTVSNDIRYDNNMKHVIHKLKGEMVNRGLLLQQSERSMNYRYDHEMVETV